MQLGYRTRNHFPPGYVGSMERDDLVAPSPSTRRASPSNAAGLNRDRFSPPLVAAPPPAADDASESEVSLDSAGIAQFERLMNRAAVYGNKRAPFPPPVEAAPAGGDAPPERSSRATAGSTQPSLLHFKQASQPSAVAPSPAPPPVHVAAAPEPPAAALSVPATSIGAYDTEKEWLRTRLRSVTGTYESALDEKEMVIQRQAQEILKLRRRIQKECPAINGISLAQLKLTNDRLSAQLAKLDVMESAQENADRVRECEVSIATLLQQLEAVEGAMVQQKRAADNECAQFQRRLDEQLAQFNVERLECDRVVHAMSAKLEELIKENAALKKGPGSKAASLRN